ncbi:BolA family protein [uncultured Cohaesibacter sp.]|uniref:BolA family protein n=1 Tax=uncultured Cohaesibacter sp. TaxID=1002546 RepID=UPI00292CAC21|nr:BolA family protein [uncultured Cohaesibacter sp.]
MTVKKNIENKLNNQLHPTMLEVIDESDLHRGHLHARPEGETHFHIRLSSPAFDGLSRVEAHRLVHDSLKEELKEQIHALRLEIIAP